MQSMITTQFDKATEITKGTQQTNKQTNQWQRIIFVL